MLYEVITQPKQHPQILNKKVIIKRAPFEWSLGILNFPVALFKGPFQVRGYGLGGILPSQGDYFQSVKGGGHGDYRLIVYAPSSVQEAADCVMEAFEASDYYRVPALVLGDGIV